MKLPGAPREISDAQVEDVITRTLESTPPAANPLEHRLHGPCNEIVAPHHLSYLAGLRSAAPPNHFRRTWARRRRTQGHLG